MIVVELFTYYSKLQQYHLKGNEEKPHVGTEPVEVKEVQNPGNATSEEVVADKAEEKPEAAAAASEESSGSTPTAVGGESTEANSGAAENSSEAATEESSENTENSGEQEVDEETPEVKVSLNIIGSLFFRHIDKEDVLAFSMYLLMYYIRCAARDSTSRFPFPYNKSN